MRYSHKELLIIAIILEVVSIKCSDIINYISYSVTLTLLSIKMKIYSYLSIVHVPCNCKFYFIFRPKDLLRSWNFCLLKLFTTMNLNFTYEPWFYLESVKSGSYLFRSFPRFLFMKDPLFVKTSSSGKVTKEVV